MCAPLLSGISPSFPSNNKTKRNQIFIIHYLNESILLRQTFGHTRYAIGCPNPKHPNRNTTTRSVQCCNEGPQIRCAAVTSPVDQSSGSGVPQSPFPLHIISRMLGYITRGAIFSIFILHMHVKRESLATHIATLESYIFRIILTF